MTTASATGLRPWTDFARPHDDVRSGDLAMGTYAANLASAALGGDGEHVYVDAGAFFRATYLTKTMRSVLAEVFGALDGKRGDRVVQLRTPFGGGKTHSLLALYHLAKHRRAATFSPELNEIPDPGRIRVAILSGEYLDPERGRQVEGRTIRTLWGELAYQLGGWEAYEWILVEGQEGAPPGGERLARLLGDAPNLILLDEVLIYIAAGKAVRRGDTNAGQQALLFLQHLTEAVNQRPRTAMVYSLQASVGEAVGEEDLLGQLEKIHGRIDVRKEPVSGDEVLRFVQRRLFGELPDDAVRRAVAEHYAEQLREQLLATAETDDERIEADRMADSLLDRIVASYPFHPELIDLMNQRWGSLPMYQRTRGALQFLATVVHALWAARASRPVGALIGPGDVDLDDQQVRSTFLEQVGETEQYTSVITADFLAADAGTRAIDARIGRAAPALDRLRVGTRVATAIMLLSFGVREGEERGAPEGEVIKASLVPALDANVIREALADMRREALLYLDFTNGRYRFDTVPNLNKLIRSEMENASTLEVLAKVRGELDRALGAEARAHAVVWPEGPEQVADEPGVFQIVYLPPDWRPEEHALDRWVEFARGNTRRKYRNGIGFAVPQVGSFDAARRAARTLVAIARLLDRARRVGMSKEQREELEDRRNTAQRELEAALKSAYERLLLPVGLASDGVEYETFDLTTTLASGRTLHQRVRDALANFVFDRMEPSRVARIARLNENGYAFCERVGKDAFSFFEHTKLWSLEPLRDAIARGVEAGAFAYVVDAQMENGTLARPAPGALRLREHLRRESVDLGPGTALVSLALANELVAPPAPTGIPTEPGAPLDGLGGGELPGGGSAVIGDRSGGSGEAATPRRTKVRLEIQAREHDLFAVQRALAGLRDLVRPGSVRVSLTVEADTQGAEIDRVGYANKVREPLDESAGVTLREEWPQ